MQATFCHYTNFPPFVNLGAKSCLEKVVPSESNHTTSSANHCKQENQTQAIKQQHGTIKGWSILQILLIFQEATIHAAWYYKRMASLKAGDISFAASCKHYLDKLFYYLYNSGPP